MLGYYLYAYTTTIILTIIVDIGHRRRYIIATFVMAIDRIVACDLATYENEFSIITVFSAFLTIVKNKFKYPDRTHNSNKDENKNSI